MDAEKATSVRRSLALLFALGGDEALAAGGLGVVRLAQIVGSEKSRVSRALRTLEQHGLVERDPQTLAYRLGWRLFGLAARAGNERLLHVAPPYLARLVGEFGERAHLSVLDGTNVLTVLSQSPPRTLQSVGWVGRSVPAHCTSSGRALLLDHDRAALAALFGGAELAADTLGPNAPRDVDDLAARVARAREHGYAVVEEELEPGLVGAAAPIRDLSGRIVAALNVSAPRFRFADRLEDAGRAARAVAGDLSAALGLGGGAAPLAAQEVR